MKLELIIFLITIFVLANTYFEGKLINKLKQYQKYYKMAFFAFIGLCIYLFIKKNPSNYKEIVTHANSYIKYLPIDKGTSSIISPILDFTTKHNFVNDQYRSIDGGDYDSYNYPIIPMPAGRSPMQNAAENRLANSGKKATKRSVSETKKKFVASRQNWKCGDCQTQLNAWFEVDHIKRLEYGGSNHIDNLVALCRECHGKKTTIENL